MTKRDKTSYWLLGYKRKWAFTVWPSRIYSDDNGIYIGVFIKKFIAYKDFSIFLHVGSSINPSGSIMEKSAHIKHQLTFLFDKQANFFFKNAKELGAGHSLVNRL